MMMMMMMMMMVRIIMMMVRIMIMMVRILMMFYQFIGRKFLRGEAKRASTPQEVAKIYLLVDIKMLVCSDIFKNKL